MAAHTFTSRVSSILLVVLYYVLPLAAAVSIGANGTLSQTAFSELAKRDYDPGSDCSQEGQWNCMGDSWQRCAAGHWSSVVKCAPGTHCTPNGLSDDMDVENTTDSSSSDSSSDSSSSSPGSTSEDGPTSVSTPTAGVPGGYAGWTVWSLVVLAIAVLAG
ncbi:hypothetical protein PG993_002190 [Apiospora rasikravindrae]|uniref:Uncharacterized protein n=1 Tax=Apiospora rasikravindrae TaxID=990691 RepID=A0ABR1UDH9_9PEZI